MKATSLLVFTAMIALSATARGETFTVVSNAIEDIQFIGGGMVPIQNRFETILNNSGTAIGRTAAVRFDTDIFGGAPVGTDFTNPSDFALVSATLTLTEETPRNDSNGGMSGTVGAFFFNTLENSDWTVGSLDSVDSGMAGSDVGDGATLGDGFFGNSLARAGALGGGGAAPDAPTNVDARSNGIANSLDPQGSEPGRLNAASGFSTVTHQFDVDNDSETVTIDLTSGGASLAEIQSILADWVSGQNAGLGLGAEFGNQVFFRSVGIEDGASVGSTVNGDSTFSGVSTDAGEPGVDVLAQSSDAATTGVPFLTLVFGPPPVPGDTDGDGVVEIEDFTPIGANFLTSDASFVRTDGDLDTNGVVNFADFLEFKTAIGPPPAAAVAAATANAVGVPEPASALLVMMGALVSCQCRRRLQ